jgi:hypothetical protein
MSMMLALLLLSAQTGAPAEPCRRALAAAPAETVCVATPHGVVLAKERRNAEALAAHAEAAETRFAARFDAPVAPYAVVSIPPAPDRAALRAAGFVHVLPWPDPDSFDRAARDGIERAVRQMAARQGFDAAQADAMIARALAMRQAEAGKAALDAGMVPHELGHLWFTHGYWPSAAREPDDAPRHYGGPGPDWLDELAAVLMEDDATTDRRRAQAGALLRGETVAAIGPVAGRETLLNLKGFLTREHPALDRAVAAAPGVAASGGIAVTFTPAGGGGAPAAAAQERLFYIQARVFADFLIQRTGDPRIFAVITRSLASGETFEGWLRANGKRLHLPTTIDGLDALWRQEH